MLRVITYLLPYNGFVYWICDNALETREITRAHLQTKGYRVNLNRFSQYFIESATW